METGEGEGGDDGESKREKGITCTLYMLMHIYTYTPSGTHIEK